MKCNSENATRQTMFSIALALTAAGFLFVIRFVPATAMATDADTIERLAFSNGAQAAMTPGAVVPETQAADIPTLKKRPPK